MSDESAKKTEDAALEFGHRLVARLNEKDAATCKATLVVVVRCAEPVGHAYDGPGGGHVYPGGERITWWEGTPGASEGGEVRPAWVVAGAIDTLRKAWRNDGAEGESVHLVCDELERSIDASAALRERVAALEGALARVIGEVDFKLSGGDCPAERCQECGEYGAGMLRDAANDARALLAAKPKGGA